MVEKFTSCQSFRIIDYTAINDYDDVKMAANLVQELLCVHAYMCTYLNGPFLVVITGKSTINILPLLAMVLFLFIISDSVWLASFEITGSMK